MKIEKNTMVSLIYELREKDQKGRVIEKLNEQNPLSFLYGSGSLLPVFESNIHELVPGDEFGFAMTSAEAYGERREEMVVDVPISVFKTEDGKLNEEICQVGNIVPMMDEQGNHLNGVVNEINDEFIIMDFNHPMAGVDLYFTGKVLSVRMATEEEIAGQSHSCSSCGSHSDGCGGCH
ncbi:MAG TPA: FKBP-type peptidyl-prolyl cis-trans isomerase [Bacteroidales bacterium]|nr:FKBP-type peptidyl-prolyl cis-trans isomerase [Bacteroidales bacterium]